MVSQIGRNELPCVDDRETLVRRCNQRILQHQRMRKKRSKSFTYDEEKDERGFSHGKKLKRSHLRRTTGQSSNQGNCSTSEVEDAEDVAVSTSNVAIHGPDPDSLQSSLRENYAKSATEKQLKEKDGNIDELEVNEEEGLEVKPTIDTGCSDLKGPMFKDLGGMTELLEDLRMDVLMPLRSLQLPRYLGVKPTTGILFHGPSGCGKTTLAHAIANEAGVPFYKISAAEIVSGVSGGSEENVRQLFSEAYRTAPSIIFIDEIDAIASKRESLQKEMERRIVTQLITCMDESKNLVKTQYSSAQSSDHPPGYVLVIAATNRPDAIDSALRINGRFDREIFLGVPDEKARIEILSVLTKNLKLEGSFNLMKIARSTPGFVAADLSALANKAGNLAIKRIVDQRKADLTRIYTDEQVTELWWNQLWLPEELEKLQITMDEFEEALRIVQPSSRREGFSTIPKVKWEDVGGLESIREVFELYIIERIKSPEKYMEFGVDHHAGFLLWGPPGCGKTLIAKAVANEAGANFIHIKGPELLNKYVGESELAVRNLFTRARTCAPCIIFFDEVDALTTERGREGGRVGESLLTQLLTELDGADERGAVFVIGATNRPEVMDEAVLRPGRFGIHLYVPLPSSKDRGLILKAMARKKPVDASVDFSAIGEMEACKNLSGADLAALTNDAAIAAMKEKEKLTSIGVSCSSTIKTTHYVQALTKIKPSVSEKQIELYRRQCCPSKTKN